MRGLPNNYFKIKIFMSNNKMVYTFRQDITLSTATSDVFDQEIE